MNAGFSRLTTTDDELGRAGRGGFATGATFDFLEPTSTPGAGNFDVLAYLSSAHRLVVLEDAGRSTVAVPLEPQLSLDYMAAIGIAAETAPGEPVDVIARFAFPLPFMVISELLGMPVGDRDQLRAWSHEMTNSIEPFNDEPTLRRMVAAAENMLRHIDDAIAWKRRNPADDLLSALLAAEEDGDRLTHDELRDQVVLLYIAGHETTVNLIGNGTLALLRHRDQFERLAADPSLDANAVDELLRYDSPVQVSRRITTTDIEIGGEGIGPGELVLTLLGSSNRDEHKWGPTAGDLDVGREGASGHLSFGSGIHHCLGSALARLEGAEAVPALVRRFPRMELATDTPAWNGRIVLRGLDALPVEVR